MLASALDVASIGGIIAYATCSIIPGENEEVIEKLHKRRRNRFENIPLAFGEARSFGSIILPDTSEGKGPLYVCVIRRLG
jgi:16S rRNA C967 or C1407 C5-methylase (RsmB/RsmF family)